MIEDLKGGGATVYLVNIPRRVSDCPVYTTASIPKLKMETSAFNQEL